MADLRKDNILNSIAGKRFDSIEIGKYRKALLSNVLGDILELGIGNGVNLKFYPPSVKHITGVDHVMKEIHSKNITVDHYFADYKQLPFEDNSFDTMVCFFVLSTVTEIDAVMSEIKRVLKPRGRLLLLESGKSEKRSDSILQELFNPMSEVFAHRAVNRDYFDLLKENDFLLANQQKKSVKLNFQSLYGTLYAGVAVNVKG